MENIRVLFALRIPLNLNIDPRECCCVDKIGTIHRRGPPEPERLRGKKRGSTTRVLRARNAARCVRS